MIVAQAEIHAHTIHNAKCMLAAIRDKWQGFDDATQEMLRPLAANLKTAMQLLTDVEYELDRTVTPMLKKTELEEKQKRDLRRKGPEVATPYS